MPSLPTANPTPLSLLAGSFLWYRRRKGQKSVNEKTTTSQKNGQSWEDTQPYLQQKAELEAKKRQKYELEARERRYEVASARER